MDPQFAAMTEQGRSVAFSDGTLAQSTIARPSYLVRHERQSPLRGIVEDFIAAEFREHFGADIRSFMPTLVGLHDTTGRLKAAVGYRAAAREPLFLETYTNGPIERVLQRQSGIDVPRSAIVEVGSLACTGGRAAMEMVAALGPALIEDGFSWVVFTGADTVRNVFRRLRLKPIALCIANKTLLGDARREWGSYYEHNPVMMAGRLADGVGALEAAALRP
jgi:hypothetical protein